MILSEFITQLNYELRGLDDDAPVAGTDEYAYWVATLNRVKDNLYKNVNQNWRYIHKTTSPVEPGTVATAGTTTLTGTSTKFTDYNSGDTITVSGETVRTIDTITSDTVLTVTSAFSTTDSSLTFTHATIIASGDSTYSMHRSFIRPSGNKDGDFYVLKTDGNKSWYDLVQPEEATDSIRNGYLSGNEPEILTFTDTIASTDNIVGGTLYIPGYYLPDDVDASTSTEVIPIPDPMWAVMQTASEIAFNDIVYEDKAPDLNAKANALYRQMVSNNRKGTHRNPRQTPVKTNVRLG